MVFVLPRENKTYFGTTGTDYTGDLEHPKVTQEDVDYLWVLSIIASQKQRSQLTTSKAASRFAPSDCRKQCLDYNGGNNGTISDESFNALIATVESYRAKENPVRCRSSYATWKAALENTWIHLPCLAVPAWNAITMAP